VGIKSWGSEAIAEKYRNFTFDTVTTTMCQELTFSFRSMHVTLGIRIDSII
jgi:hypothetical protein